MNCPIWGIDRNGDGTDRLLTFYGHIYDTAYSLAEQVGIISGCLVKPRMSDFAVESEKFIRCAHESRPYTLDI